MENKMLLSYKENEIYYLGMFQRYDGDCDIILYKKIDENHGERIYEHTCREITKNEDFKKYYEIEEMIMKNENEKIKEKYELCKY